MGTNGWTHIDFVREKDRLMLNGQWFCFYDNEGCWDKCVRWEVDAFRIEGKKNDWVESCVGQNI